MTRRFLFGACALLVLALVTVVASAVFDSGGEQAAAGGAYAVQAVASVPDGWQRVDVYQDAGGGLHFVVVPAPPSATPTPTLTPPATNTPRPTATPTPTATATRTPTPPASFTPVPTVAYASPTPEIATPAPITPGPTQEPPDYGCYGTVAVAGLRVRSEPSTSATTLTSLMLNDRLTVLEAKHVDVYGSAGELYYTNVWLRVRHPRTGTEGWSAGYYGKETFIVLDNTDECLDMQYGTDGGALITRGVGWTVTIGASADTLNAAAVDIRRAGYTPALTVAAETNSIPALLAGGWVVNWRPFYDIGAGDCGDKTVLPAEAAAWARVEALAPYVEGKLAAWGVRGTKRVVVQLENECWHPSAAYANAWISAAAAYCSARGWTCIPAVWATGNPDAAWLTALEPAMQALASKGHWWGMNTGPYRPELMLCADVAGSITDYTTWSGRFVRQHAPPNLRIWVTESARGNAEQTVDLTDYLCFVRKAHKEKLYDVVDMWYYGGLDLGSWRLSRWSREQVLDFARLAG